MAQGKETTNGVGLAGSRIFSWYTDTQFSRTPRQAGTDGGELARTNSDK
jgi:hypothetical protein